MIKNFLIRWVDVHGHPHTTSVDADDLNEALSFVEAEIEEPIAYWKSARVQLTQNHAAGAMKP